MEEAQALLAKFLAELTKPVTIAKAPRPKRGKVCRCKAPLPEGLKNLCDACWFWENQDWRENGPDRRKALNIIVKEMRQLA